MKNAVDLSIAGVALSSPTWLTLIETGLGLAALAGGLVLLVLRIGLAIREWRNRDKKN